MDNLILLKNFQVEKEKEYILRRQYYEGKKGATAGVLRRGTESPTKSAYNWTRTVHNQLLGFPFNYPVNYIFTNQDDFVDFKKKENLNILDMDNYSNCLLYGRSIETVLPQPNMVQSYDPINWQLIKDENDELVYAIRRICLPKGAIYQKRYLEKDMELYVIYDQIYLTTYIKGFGKNFELYQEPIAHGMQEVPIVEYYIDSEGFSAISDELLNEINNFNKLSATLVDEIGASYNAILRIGGIDPASVMTPDDSEGGATALDKMKSNNVMFADDANFISTGSDYQKYELAIKHIRKNIHEQASIVDVDSIIQGNGTSPSGISLKLKFQPLSLISNKYTTFFGQGLEKRFKLIDFIRKELQSKMEYGLQGYEFVYALETNETEQIDNVIKLHTAFPILDISQLMDMARSLKNFDFDALTASSNDNQTDTSNTDLTDQAAVGEPAGQNYKEPINVK